MYLPTTNEAFARAQTEIVESGASVHQGGSILVMDDEEIIRDLTAKILEHHGYQAMTCDNGAEAVTLYKEAKLSGKPFLAVIMDLTVAGGMGGKEAAEQILAIDPTACLIVSSGYSNDPIMSDYTTYGFRAAVAKPYNVKEFTRLLGSLLEL
jgi:CheY-like chemotaxis protein